MIRDNSPATGGEKHHWAHQQGMVAAPNEGTQLLQRKRVEDMLSEFVEFFMDWGIRRAARLLCSGCV